MMTDSRDVFNSRIEKTHVQRDEMNKFNQLYKEGKAILGVENDEMEKLLKDLDNDSVKQSNDMVIEMILDKVKNYTDDSKLLRILNNINIANISSDNSIIGRSYLRYYDGSYYIEISRDMEKRIMMLSDLFAVLFMYNEDIGVIENILLEELLYANKLRFSKNVEFDESFNRVQKHMIIFDKLYKDKDFINKYISYSNEIYEMALAILVGHEVGHHYYGDTDRDIKDDTNAKIKEVKADCYGVDFAFYYLQGSYANDEKRYGIHQFAGIYLPLIVSSYLCNSIFADQEKHPAIIKRFFMLEKKLKNKIDDDDAYQEVRNYISKLLKIIEFNNLI